MKALLHIFPEEVKLEVLYPVFTKVLYSSNNQDLEAVDSIAARDCVQIND